MISQDKLLEDLMLKNARLIDERDALAAYVERQTKLLEEARDRFDGIGERMWDEISSLLQETPTTSLARLKAECWREAYLAGMEHGHHWTVEGGYVTGDEEAAEDYVADRQAEEDS